MRAPRLSALSAIGVLSLALTGCLGSPISPPPGPELTAEPQTPTPLESPPEVTMEPVPDATDCANRPLTVDSTWGGSPVTGICPLVEVDGTDLRVDVAGAQVEQLVIRGDRIQIIGGDIGTLTIGGQDNAVDAAGLGALDIAGDRNRVDVMGDLAAVVVGGNDNDVLADRIGAVTARGGGNQIRSR